MLREYEVTIVSRADLLEADSTKLLGKYEKLMTADGGEILKKDSWGSKKIAFPMKKHHRGLYTNYDFVGVPANLSEMERLMRIDEDVLRYMSVFIGENVDPTTRKDQIAKAAAAARESANADFRSENNTER
ncbi:MAG: 30S ribosomal protein S6 [Proteobacteria bacterium]|nr:30S ribosomal protein S6 [Pseudomonadota bacterium]